MALYTFEWRENEPNPVNIHHTPHICANRPTLTSFLEEVQLLPFGLTRNPFTGMSLAVSYMSATAPGRLIHRATLQESVRYGIQLRIKFSRCCCDGLDILRWSSVEVVGLSEIQIREI